MKSTKSAALLCCVSAGARVRGYKMLTRLLPHLESRTDLTRQCATRINRTSIDPSTKIGSVVTDRDSAVQDYDC
jgi:hypothetical protein